ncbi:hypothetical protein ACFLWU_00480 [Chloroflexota bacterium]
MIRMVIRLRNNMAIVFDSEGEQVPEYQGLYGDVKDRILSDTSSGTVFYHWFGHSLVPEVVTRNKWLEVGDNESEAK